MTRWSSTTGAEPMEKDALSPSEWFGDEFWSAYILGGVRFKGRSDGSSACVRQRRVRQMRIVRRSRADLDLDRVDWAKVDATSDAEIDRQIARDSDTAPVFSAKQLATARRVGRDDVEDVRRLRARLGLSQEAFARRFGFSVDAIRQYEGGRRTPTGPIRTLLRVIAREPDAVTRALAVVPAAAKGLRRRRRAQARSH